MYPAALYRDKWKPFDRQSVNFYGLACCLYVAEYDDGKISVELLPEDEDEREHWPLDVLRLSPDLQREILSQLQLP